MQEETIDKDKGVAFSIFSAILLSLSYIFFAVLLKQNTESQVQFYWFLTAFIFSLLFAIGRLKNTFNELKQHYKALTILGLAEGAGTVLFLTSLKMLGPIITAFFTQFVFVFILIYAITLLNEKFNLVELLGIIIAIIGILVISWSQQVVLIAAGLLTITAAFLFASSNFMAKKYIKKVSPKSINLTRLSFTALFGFAYIFVQNQSFAISTNNLWLIIIGAFLCPFLGFELFYNSLKHIKLATSSTIRALSPLFTAVLAFLILSQTLDLVKGIGGVLIIVGVLILIKWQKK